MMNALVIASLVQVHSSRCRPQGSRHGFFDMLCVHVQEPIRYSV